MFQTAAVEILDPANTGEVAQCDLIRGIPRDKTPLVSDLPKTRGVYPEGGGVSRGIALMASLCAVFQTFEL